MNSLYVHFKATPYQVKEVERKLKVEVNHVAGEPDDLYFHLLDCDDWEQEDQDAEENEAIKTLLDIGCKNVFSVVD